MVFQGMEYVYEVYREKSFSKAAQNLFVSQPSLSATVKRIEQKMGYPIFDRSTKPLGLTECGEKYITAVEKILDIENEFVNYINDWGNLKTGNLVLGGSSLFSSWILPQIIGNFSAKYPLIKIMLVEENTSRLEEMLQNGKVDLMIDNCMLDVSVFDKCDFKEEHLLLAVPRIFSINEQLKKYALSSEDIRTGKFLDKNVPSVSLNLFKNEPFIVLKPDNDTGKRAINLCHESGFSPNIVIELDQQQTSYNVTCSGLGVSFISDTLVMYGTDNSSVVYYKLKGRDSLRKIFFYWKKGRYFNRVMEEFLKTADCKI